MLTTTSSFKQYKKGKFYCIICITINIVNLIIWLCGLHNREKLEWYERWFSKWKIAKISPRFTPNKGKCNKQYTLYKTDIIINHFLQAMNESSLAKKYYLRYRAAHEFGQLIRINGLSLDVLLERMIEHVLFENATAIWSLYNIGILISREVSIVYFTFDI